VEDRARRGVLNESHIPPKHKDPRPSTVDLARLSAIAVVTDVAAGQTFVDEGEPTAADAIASAVIGLLILPSTWSLLRDAVDVLLEATPKGLDMTLVRSHILEAPGVIECHDLHVWTITSGMHVVSAHVIVDRTANPAEVLDQLVGGV